MRPALEAVVFDLDGTLTLPHALDFDLMRRMVGAPEGTDVLAYAHSLEGEDKARAFAAIEDIETSALNQVKLQPHLALCIEHIDSVGLRRAIITRNGSHAVDHFLAASSLQFEKIVTRDFLPCKPAGDPLLHVAETLGVDPARTVMVGDSKDDLACGRAAGAHTVLLLNERNHHHRGDADHVVTGLDGLVELLATKFTKFHAAA